MTFNPKERADALSGADRDVSLFAYDQYFRELAWMEPISTEEREKLLLRVRRGNAERVQPSPNQWVLSLATHARERLVEVYQPLVVKVARSRSFLFQSADLMDVIQEGNLGLLDALDKYTDNVACRYPSFVVFATLYIRTALRAASDGDAFIRLPYDKQRLLTRCSVVRSELSKLLGYQPSLSHIAEVLGVSERELTDVLDAGKRRAVKSVQELLERDERAEDTKPFERLYASSVVAEDARQADLAATFARVFEAAVPEQQREILELRYGFGEVPTTVRSAQVVAEMVGVNETNVRTQEKKVFKRLTRLLEPVTLDDGRLSCTFDDIYSDEYCTSREAATLLGIDASYVNRFARRGLLPFTMRPRRQGTGSHERVFKKTDIIAFRRSRGSALLPSVVA